MATLSHLLTFFSLSSHKHSALPLSSINTYHSPLHYYHHPTISASSIKKKPRASRKVRSNADLCNDIREFISAVGLPEGHVPSLKELSQHGRQDLANIVRRRGYKLIKELLATSTKSNGKGSDTEEGLIEKQDIGGECEYESTGDGFGILNEIGADYGKGIVEFENVTKGSSSLGEEQSEWVIGRSDTVKTLNGSISPPKQVVLPALGNNTPRDDSCSSEGLLSADYDEELDVETRKRENQIEVNHLKFMLHQKELELSQLKEQIEKEKLALSLLETKAETEISKAQNLILEKDAELHAAEESLSELVEVQIQYRGDGETVEVAGSFNGWHHRIAMDQQPSSSTLDPIGSRKSRLWTAVLWLYPGIYEIKFIVDGHWRIDPQRESIMRGTIQNNILCVDR